MNEGDFGVDCENCWCLTCIKNDNNCQNCNNCNGNLGYSRWIMDCDSCAECENPEETAKIILG